MRSSVGFALAALGLAVLGCSGMPSVDREAMAAKIEAASAARSPMTGKSAPDFTLPDQNAEAVTLSDLRDRWVVLYFYPEDDTPGCTCQANEFTDLLTEFHAADADVLGVSPDTPERHRTVIAKYDIRIRLLSDPTYRVMRRYGAYVEQTLGRETFGRVVRQTFLIAPDGTIRHHWPEVVPHGHAARVLATLNEHQQAPATQMAEAGERP